MIAELRTYSLFPGTVPKALDRIASGLSERTTLSPLAGLWETQSGRLHQIIHVWPFQDLAERERVRARFKELRNWPARTGEWTEESETKIMHPAPFTPRLEPRHLGPVYEIRTDTYRPGRLNDIVASWSSALADGVPPSFVGAWHTDLGTMNQWIHIWGFPSLDARATGMQQFEQRLHAGGAALADLFVKQLSAICKPAWFSPLQ
jgi:hypothetical protein